MLTLMIEIKRKRMISLASKHGFSAKETVECSQELDKLLNIHRQVVTAEKKGIPFENLLTATS